MTTSERIRILMVDDHPLFSEGLATVIQHQPDMLPVGRASSGREAIQRFTECSPDVTLMDLQLPDMSGIDAITAIRSMFAQARFIILTTFAGDAEIQWAMDAGARAYLLKTMPPEELMDVIRQVHMGKKKIPSEIAAHSAEHYSDEQRTARKEEIAASLADEIIGPIAAAITSANSCMEWLAREPPNLDRVRAAAIRIDKYGNHAAEIINRIRSLYKKSPSTT